MDSISCFPAVTITDEGPVSAAFLARDLTTLQQAAHWLKAVPYGSNSDASNSWLVFTENRGTCTTKHSLFARLAAELGVPIYKNNGFYRLNDAIVTGVSAILAPHGLTYIPQMHCFLQHQDSWVDLTEGNCNGKNTTIENYDFIVRVLPDMSRTDAQQQYVEYLKKYFAWEPRLAELGVEAVLGLLEKCEQQLKYQCAIMAAA
ncbi:MAG: hypothetical protein AAFQ61_07355 [Cyanobacteria bacterium J06626_23]